MRDAAAGELRLAIADVERVARSLSVPERRSIFLTDKWEPYARLALIERERGDYAAAFAASERMRARQMLDLFSRASVARPATADRAVVEHERQLRTRIAELTQRLQTAAGTSALRGPNVSDKTSGVTREALALAQDEYEHVFDGAERRNGRISRGRSDVREWRAGRGTTRTRSGLLEYLVTDSPTLVFVVRSD